MFLKFILLNAYYLTGYLKCIFSILRQGLKYLLSYINLKKTIKYCGLTYEGFYLKKNDKSKLRLYKLYILLL